MKIYDFQNICDQNVYLTPNVFNFFRAANSKTEVTDVMSLISHPRLDFWNCLHGAGLSSG